MSRLLAGTALPHRLPVAKRGRGLRPRELQWARIIVETLFPNCSSVDLLRFQQFLRETLDALPLSSAVALRAAIALATVAPVVVLRPVLLGQLNEAQRLEVLLALASSDAYAARSVYALLKAVAARACASVARAGGRS
ncbi:MAG: hypothetical protein IPJ65_26100 [Archangiaceae bacterium]|nr:hypothetical protein [Archangiaceae bacterium]